MPDFLEFVKTPANRIEYVFVVEGRATLIANGSVTVLESGDEATVLKGTPQRTAVVAGTRTIHVFGGRRARREGDRERT